MDLKKCCINAAKEATNAAKANALADYDCDNVLERLYITDETGERCGVVLVVSYGGPCVEVDSWECEVRAYYGTDFARVDLPNLTKTLLNQYYLNQ